MFAHVVTAQAEPEDFEKLARFVGEQLPHIPHQPGFEGFYLFRDPESDRLMTISLWATANDLRASVSRAAGQAAGTAALTEVHGDTYEVTMSA